MKDDYVDSFLAWRQSCIWIQWSISRLISWKRRDGSSDFLMGKYEVTIGEWIALMGRTYENNLGQTAYNIFDRPFP